MRSWWSLTASAVVQLDRLDRENYGRCPRSPFKFSPTCLTREHYAAWLADQLRGAIATVFACCQSVIISGSDRKYAIESKRLFGGLLQAYADLFIKVRTHNNQWCQALVTEYPA